MNIQRSRSVWILALGLSLSWMAMAQVKPGGPGAKVDQPKETLWSLIVKGGPVMVPLGLCSVVGLALAVERAVSLRRRQIIPADFIEGLRPLVPASKDAPVDAAIGYCEASKTPTGEIFKAGIMCLPLGPTAVEKAIEDAGAREVDKLKRSLRGLVVVGSISPLLGLLGTVYGLIDVFQVAAVGGMGKADLLAKGIYEALVTTAAGLTIAIPVVLVYQYFSAKVDALVDEMDEMGLIFMASVVHKLDTSATRG